MNLYISGSNSTYATSINRLSGDLNLDSIGRFSIIDVIKGNLFSCGTLPADDITPLDEYNCGSWDLETSLFTWLSFLGVCIVLLIAFTWSLYFKQFLDKLICVFPSSLRLFQEYVELELQSARQLAQSLTQLVRILSFLCLSIFVAVL